MAKGVQLRWNQDDLSSLRFVVSEFNAGVYRSKYRATKVLSELTTRSYDCCYSMINRELKRNEMRKNS